MNQMEDQMKEFEWRHEVVAWYELGEGLVYKIFLGL